MADEKVEAFPLSKHDQGHIVVVLTLALKNLSSTQLDIPHYSPFFDPSCVHLPSAYPFRLPFVHWWVESGGTLARPREIEEGSIIGVIFLISLNFFHRHSLFVSLLPLTLQLIF